MNKSISLKSTWTREAVEDLMKVWVSHSKDILDGVSPFIESMSKTTEVFKNFQPNFPQNPKAGQLELFDAL